MARTALQLLINHQRAASDRCACGWARWDHSHAQHVLDELAADPQIIEGLARALRAAWGRETLAYPTWEDLTPELREPWLVDARAGLAHLAGGADG